MGKMIGLLIIFTFLALSRGDDKKSESADENPNPPVQWPFADKKSNYRSDQSHSASNEKKPPPPPPLFYGVTYFPWRSSSKNCEEISEKHVADDFEWLSMMAKNIQIFDLYCNLTAAIVEKARKNKRSLLMGLSADNQAEFESNKIKLRRLLNGDRNLSHILAITVGRTSTLKGSNKHQALKNMDDISTLINTSRFPDIPVTMIIDTPIDQSLISYLNSSQHFDDVRVISGKTQPEDPKLDPNLFFYKFLESWFKERENSAKDKPRQIFYTEFGFPLPSDNDTKSSAEKFFTPENGFPTASVQALMGLSCTDKVPAIEAEAELDPHGPRPPLDKGTVRKWFPIDGGFKYFYHSSFDMPFQFGQDDPRSRWGLADIKTREPKLPWKMTKDAAAIDPHHCSSRFFHSKQRPDGKNENKELEYQWIAIGISMSLALIAITVLIILVMRYRRQRKLEENRKHTELELNTTGSNAYIRTLASYLSRGDYVDVISRSDYENLSALVGPEWLVDEGALQFEEIIGEGHFGIVQKATLRSADKSMEVAVKKLHVGAKNVRKFLSEGILMEQFHHVNVLPLVGISFTSYYLPMIVTPFMKRGDLLSFIKNGENRLTVRQLLRFGSEIAQGVAYLHDLKLIHRDLAARNCMLDEWLTVKIADFGLCRDISDSESYQTARASDIPIRWMPPETIEKLEWTNKSDVWSYGVVLWELFTRGKQPYTRVPIVELRAFLFSGGRLAKPDGCPDIIYNLMKNCWHGEAEQRPDFHQLGESIPTLVQALEGEQILDLPDYYNALPLVEMAQMS